MNNDTKLEVIFWLTLASALIQVAVKFLTPSFG